MISTGIFYENFLAKERNIMINIVILIFSKVYIFLQASYNSVRQKRKYVE